MNTHRTIDTVATRDGTIIHFTDWGHGQPVVFGHGWPQTQKDRRNAGMLAFPRT
ncbi:alpha/beta fold hydrolase [Pseudoduganella lutea]|uniref:alpha/beta fold hydrolase n=1 Tax=Pseudoduganella lutea TaxID=321985 RepID=UPI001E3EC5C7|nr:hypothetical protein [Pseudoduganella lutea]